MQVLAEPGAAATRATCAPTPTRRARRRRRGSPSVNADAGRSRRRTAIRTRRAGAPRPRPIGESSSTGSSNFGAASCRGAQACWNGGGGRGRRELRAAHQAGNRVRRWSRTRKLNKDAAQVAQDAGWKEAKTVARGPKTVARGPKTVRRPKTVARRTGTVPTRGGGPSRQTDAPIADDDADVLCAQVREMFTPRPGTSLTSAAWWWACIRTRRREPSWTSPGFAVSRSPSCRAACFPPCFPTGACDRTGRREGRRAETQLAAAAARTVCGVRGPGNWYGGSPGRPAASGVPRVRGREPGRLLQDAAAAAARSRRLTRQL